MGSEDGERSVDRAAGRALDDGPRTAILVTGMHRNGTSALARTLSLLGAALPSDLVPANEGNPHGHWEPRGMVDLNDRMLADAGSDLYGVRDIPAAWFESPAASAFTDDAVRLIAGSFADERLVVLKDPRTALLAPIWNRALAIKGYRVVHVLPLRHPADVAASLRRRHLQTIPYDAWASPRGEAVWLRYTLAAVRGSRGHARAFLRYGDLLADWRREIGRLARDLGIAWPALGTGRDAEVDAFLHANDRADGDHAAIAPDPRTLGDLDLPTLAAACYDELASSGDDGTRVDAFGAEFTRRIAGAGDLIGTFEDLYALVWRFFEEAGSLATRLDLSLAAEGRQRERVQQTWAALTEANSDKLRLRLDAGSRDRQIVSLQGELARLDGAVGSRDARIADLERQVARLDAELAGFATSHEARFAEQRGVADTARRDHADAVSRLAALHSSTSWRFTAPLRALSRAVRGRA